MTAILDILNRRQQDWATLAKSDAGAAGTFARGFASVKGGNAIMADVPSVDIRVDENTVTSWWTVSTPNLDREGDSLIPAGCLKTIENYRRNPVVLHEHNALWPVGISVGDKGMPFRITDDGISAGLKHFTGSPMGRDVYEQVKAGILRCASIAFLPLKAKQLGEVHKGSLVSPRFRFDEWDCTHWATTTQPQNPEAVRMLLSRGKIESDYFKKSLADYAEKPLEYAHGWTPEENTMATVNFRDIQTFRLAKSAFIDLETAKTFLVSIGGDSSVLFENDTSFDFAQQAGEHQGSVKIAKGVQGLLLKGKSVTDPPAVLDKKLPIDETPDELVEKAAKPKEKPKEGKESKGPPRVTHAVQGCADIGNHIAGAKQYLTEGQGLLDHDPTVDLYKKLSEMHDEMAEMIADHTKEHFGDVDMAKVGQERIAAKEEEEGAKKKQKKSVDDEAQEQTLTKLTELFDKRQKSLDATGKALESAAAFQKVVKNHFALN